MPNYVAGVGSLSPKLMAIGLTSEEIMKRLLKYRKILDNGCWDWLAKKDHGYARVKTRGRSYRVIRLICVIYHGLDINNKKLQANHKLPCNYEGCWNPQHLYIGSHKENQADRSRTITHCKNGHSLEGCRTHFNKVTGTIMRTCRICHMLRQRKNNKRYYESRKLRNVS